MSQRTRRDQAIPGPVLASTPTATLWSVGRDPFPSAIASMTSDGAIQMFRACSDLTLPSAAVSLSPLQVDSGLSQQPLLHRLLSGYVVKRLLCCCQLTEPYSPLPPWKVTWSTHSWLPKINLCSRSLQQRRKSFSQQCAASNLRRVAQQGMHW